MKLANVINRSRTFASHRIHNLAVVVLMPHSRCNCRCVMCDIWKANANKSEITHEELSKHVGQFKKLGVQEILFSGGEALMHSNLWSLCELLENAGIKMTLLSTGLLLERNNINITKYFHETIVSLDGSPEVHDKIRNIPEAFSKLAAGVAALRKAKAGYRVTGRSVLQRHNFFDFDGIVHAARQAGLDQISFLPADVSTGAFNHEEGPRKERTSAVALDYDETLALEKSIVASFVELKSDYESHFIAEGPQKMLRIVAYYKAINGQGEFSAPPCNAPWVSAVVESDGRVMPCFFHAPYGNIYDSDFLSLLNSPEAISFRENLNVARNPTCRKCVCALRIGRTEMT